MTWRWPICFSVLLAAPALAATVTGRVRLTDSLQAAVRKQQNYSGVVVWLQPLSEPPANPVHPLRAAMEQKGKRFIPHVLAVQAGTDVSFPNLDPIYHSVFSNFSGQIFDLGLYPPGADRNITFRRTGIVRVFCNIHPTMSAVIVVLKHPWFAVSAADGSFRIPDVPPGDYELHLFHERATAATLRALERKVTVAEERVAVALIPVSETGYMEAPHKNKFGQDYPPARDAGAYPSDRP